MYHNNPIIDVIDREFYYLLQQQQGKVPSGYRGVSVHPQGVDTLRIAFYNKDADSVPVTSIRTICQQLYDDNMDKGVSPVAELMWPGEKCQANGYIIEKEDHTYTLTDMMAICINELATSEETDEEKESWLMGWCTYLTGMASTLTWPQMNDEELAIVTAHFYNQFLTFKGGESLARLHYHRTPDQEFEALIRYLAGEKAYASYDVYIGIWVNEVQLTRATVVDALCHADDETDSICVKGYFVEQDTLEEEGAGLISLRDIIKMVLTQWLTPMFWHNLENIVETIYNEDAEDFPLEDGQVNDYLNIIRLAHPRRLRPA